jgi:hypothetical protein
MAPVPGARNSTIGPGNRCLAAGDAAPAFDPRSQRRRADKMRPLPRPLAGLGRKVLHASRKAWPGPWGVILLIGN